MRRSARRAALAIFAVAAFAASAARAQPADELMQLKEEAARMRASLDALDARIRALEAERGGAPASDAGASYVQLMRNWAQVEPGTPKARVDAVLGAPARELRIDGGLVWYYVYPGVGRASVFFNGKDEVSAVQRPR